MRGCLVSSCRPPLALATHSKQSASDVVWGAQAVLHHHLSKHPHGTIDVVQGVQAVLHHHLSSPTQSTVTPHELHKRECGNVRGVPDVGEVRSPLRQ